MKPWALLNCRYYKLKKFKFFYTIVISFNSGVYLFICQYPLWTLSDAPAWDPESRRLRPSAFLRLPYLTFSNLNDVRNPLYTTT